MALLHEELRKRTNQMERALDSMSQYPIGCKYVSCHAILAFGTGRAAAVCSRILQKDPEESQAAQNPHRAIVVICVFQASSIQTKMQLTTVCVCLALCISSSFAAPLSAFKAIREEALGFPPFCRGTPCPDYEVVKKTSNYELRKFEPSEWHAQDPACT